jgi:hypothetical protein
MEQHSFSGIWVLKHRDEVYADEESTSKLKDDSEKYIPPDMEILYFPDCEGLVIQMGIRMRIGSESPTTASDERYEESYCFPGHFNIEKQEIFINEAGTIDLKDNGQMHVTFFCKDYVCQEIWECMKDDVSELRQFIESCISES